MTPTSSEVEQAIRDELDRPDTSHQRILFLAYMAWAAQTVPEPDMVVPESNYRFTDTK